MISKNVKFNKVIFDINKDYLNGEYQLFSLSNNRNVKTNIFTTVCSHKDFMNQVESCVCKDKWTMYVLTTDDISDIFLMYDDIIIKKEDIFKVDDILLLNLILNLDSANQLLTNDPISNLDGQKYLFMSQKGKGDSPREILTLKLRFHCGEFGPYLTSDLTTFTKLSLFNDKVKNNPNYPKYCFTSNKTLTRTNETDANKLYICKKINDKKNNIKECEFSNEKFRECRIYSYYLVYKILNESEFMNRFEFIGDEFYPIGNEFSKFNAPQLSKSEICIVNTTDTENIEEDLYSLLSGDEFKSHITNLTKLQCDIKTIGKLEKEKQKRYIIIIPNNEEESDNLHHSPNIIKQCITAENATGCNKTTTMNILFQLQIKEDIKRNKITISNMLNAEKDIRITAIKISYNKDKEDNKYYPSTYSSITIDNNGVITDALTNQPLSDLNDEVVEFAYKFDDRKEKHILVINGEVFDFDKTGYKTIPDIAEIYKRLTKNMNFAKPVSYFLGLIESEIVSRNKNKYNDDFNKIKSSFTTFDENVFVQDFLSVCQEKCEKQKASIYNKLVAYMDDNEIYYVNKFRKAGNTLEKMLACYSQSCFKIMGNSFYYFMQSRNPSDSPKLNEQNANHIYNITNINNKNITEQQKDIFLWLLCVTFVKFNCYSTKPFLFKYLDEIENIEKEKEQKINEQP